MFAWCICFSAVVGLWISVWVQLMTDVVGCHTLQKGGDGEGIC
jgi:hypothetical protein